MTETVQTDRELMEKVKIRDDYAFEELVNRYKNRLFSVIYRLIGDRQETEDILQETFLRVYRERKSYNPEFCFSTWIYTIALNLARNQLKRKKDSLFWN